MSERGVTDILVVSHEPGLAEEVRSALRNTGPRAREGDGGDDSPEGTDAPRDGQFRVHTAASEAQVHRALDLGTKALLVVELGPGAEGEELGALDLLMGSHGESLPPVLVVAEAIPSHEVRRRLLERVDAVLERPLASGELKAAMGALLPGRGIGEEPEAPSAPTVLVVEDDPVTTELLRHRLTRDGFTVQHFGDGLDAYNAAASHPASLALLDVKLPGMDGLELLERLRRLPAWSAVPIVMITSVAGSKDVVRAFELGANDYVVKPFSPPEVVARLRRLLA